MKERKPSMLAIFAPAVIFVVILWCVELFGVKSSTLGVRPRELEYLPQVLTYPLVHGDLQHLISNTIPILIMLPMIFYFYPRVAWKAMIWMYVLSGFWLWLSGRSSFHIGASGLVYGMIGFLFVSGMTRRDKVSMAVAFVTIFIISSFYGSIISGLLPGRLHISWEGHLMGFIAGSLVAYLYRKVDLPPKEVLKEEDDGLQYMDYKTPEELRRLREEEMRKNQQSVEINYIFKEKEK